MLELYPKIRISYIDVLNTSEERRRDLLENYYFWCDCVRCNSSAEDFEMNAAKCSNLKCRAFVDIRKSKCQKCGHHISDRSRELFVDAVTFTSQYLLQMRTVACKGCYPISFICSLYFSNWFSSNQCIYRCRCLRDLPQEAENDRASVELVACENSGCSIWRLHCGWQVGRGSGIWIGIGTRIPVSSSIQNT